jgi:hypothetical protein
VNAVTVGLLRRIPWRACDFWGTQGMLPEKFVSQEVVHVPISSHSY